MKIRRIIDITKKVHANMTIWPGDSGVEVTRDLSISAGDPCNLSSIAMGLHSGTHVDSPLHFLDKGVDVASVDLSRFIGPAKVFEILCKRAIMALDLKDLPINENDIVIFKTFNSELPENSEFQKDFISLDESAANFLAEKKVKTVGIDYLSVEGFHSRDHATHHILLSNSIGIIENLYLRAVAPGEYFLSCLPLKIEGAEGSPARAVLLEIYD